MPHPQLLDTQVWTAPPNLRSDYPGDPMRFLGMRLLTQYHAANEETHKLFQKQSEFDWPHVACLTLGWSFGQVRQAYELSLPCRAAAYAVGAKVCEASKAALEQCLSQPAPSPSNGSPVAHSLCFCAQGSITNLRTPENAFWPDPTAKSAPLILDPPQRPSLLAWFLILHPGTAFLQKLDRGCGSKRREIMDLPLCYGPCLWKSPCSEMRWPKM